MRGINQYYDACAKKKEKKKYYEKNVDSYQFIMVWCGVMKGKSGQAGKLIRTIRTMSQGTEVV